MIKLTAKTKVISAIAGGAVILAGLGIGTYLKVLPALVSNAKVIKFVEDTASKSLGVELNIKNPVLKTHLKPVIEFKVDEISLTQNEDKMFTLQKLDTKFSFARILKKRLDVEKFGLDYVYADVNRLMTLVSATEEKKPAKKSDFFINLFDSLLYIKQCNIIYDIVPGMTVKISGKDMEITDTRNPKIVRFKIKADIDKNGKKLLSLAFKDWDRVYIKDRKFHVKDCFFLVGKSPVYINYEADEHKNFDFTIASKDFDLKNVIDLIRTDLLIPNGTEILSYFKNINGGFNFIVKLNNDGINGKVKLNKAALNIVPLGDLKINANAGEIEINNNDILLKNFKGYYNNSQSNPLTLNGTVKDYMKTCATNVVIDTVATNAFAQNNLSKLVGYPIGIQGAVGTKLIVDVLGEKIDMVWMSKVKKGDDILIDGASFSPVNYDRAVKGDFHLVNNKLNIESINYYIAQELNKNSKGIKPILTVSGNVDVATAKILNLGFDIPKPLPSEFLNVLIGQKMFRRGKIDGNLEFVNTGKIPVIKGKLTMDGVRIPSQRLSIKKAVMFTHNGLINLVASGRYKRSEYEFNGSILNQILFPIVIKDVNLKIADMDIARVINSMNNQPTAQVQSEVKAETIASATEDVSEIEDENNDAANDAVTFNAGILIVERCIFNLVKGNYNDVQISDLKANLTLDKNGILEVKSNRFNIAEGISSLKVRCDLKKHLYSLVLGVKDVNSDVLATAILNLKREISGKASGIISINTDDSLKLNGFIKFSVKDGTIGKVGLIEYVLKFASLFRNPLASISPSTIGDLVNIPEGNFDKITGDIVMKDNVIEKIDIRSAAPQLSAFIAGRFDLGTRDATLRIYTKFSSQHKGFAGFLRNISLNSLANRVPLSSRNDSNYYSAELSLLPDIDADEKDCQVFLTTVDGDVEHNNFISSLKKIK